MILYKAQIFPPPNDSLRQINVAMSCFLWKGAIFRVPLLTPQQPKGKGGRALTHVSAKYMTLFIQRMERQSQQTGTLTARWIEKWKLNGRSPNPQT